MRNFKGKRIIATHSPSKQKAAQSAVRAYIGTRSILALEIESTQSKLRRTKKQYLQVKAQRSLDKGKTSDAPKQCYWPANNENLKVREFLRMRLDEGLGCSIVTLEHSRASIAEYLALDVVILLLIALR